MPVPTDLTLVRGRPGLLGTGLILLALWVQVLAPMAALRMALSASQMPGTILCGHPTGSDAISVSADLPATPPACDVCRLCRAGMVPPPIPDVPARAGRLRWTASAWPIPPPAHPKPAPRVVGQPRAPPVTA
ncbi:DUF2946 domain-containing protein [Methylobacterium sp. J-048]|uniref:DUF2946 family protein n=1 Tax=Methylobacterium sp. J-048 TaxID=2836635 RepID=UPI001FBB0027|nr:DUF2946 family protein [Methylobacterium sp. J-048]MCJ2057689.1 DUF2946 domain-containing protein [Methylobacterium sp. J-048]